jgi:hypothetical protein
MHLQALSEVELLDDAQVEEDLSSKIVTKSVQISGLSSHIARRNALSAATPEAEPSSTLKFRSRKYLHVKMSTEPHQKRRKLTPSYALRIDRSQTPGVVDKNLKMFQRSSS